MDNGSEDAKLRDAFRRMAPSVDATLFQQKLEIKLSPPAEERKGLVAVTDGSTDGWKRTSVLRWGRGFRVAVYAAVAFVLVAAISVGSLEVGKHLGKDQPIVVITDDTAGISPGSTGTLPGAGTSATPRAVARPRLLWEVPTGGPIYSPPAISGGIVYVASGGGYAPGRIRALDAGTGAEIWRYDGGDYNRLSGPAAADGVVYFGSDDHNLYALDAKTGRPVWTFETGGALGWSSSPVVSEGVVYVGSHDSYLYAVDSQTGQQRWRFWTGAPVDVSPAVSGDVVCVTSLKSEAETSNLTLYAVDTQTGKLRWQFDIADTPYLAPPAIADGVVYVRGESDLYALDLQTGAVRWRSQVCPPTAYSLAAVSPSEYAVYLNVSSSSSAGSLLAVSTVDGRTLWAALVGAAATAPLVGEGRVYVGAGGYGDGTVRGFDAQTGQENWRFGAPPGPDILARPTVSDGVVYIGDIDGWMHAVK
jgi:eukaryotic-like serine/threonine-protein kinase